MNKKVLISVVSFLGVGAIIVLSALLINQQNEINNLKNGTSKISSSNETKKETKTEEIKKAEVNPTISKKSFESKHTNLKFEYPETWTLSENQTGTGSSNDAHAFYTALTNKNGKKIILTEEFNGGLGGICDREYAKHTVNIKKLGESRIAGFSILEIPGVAQEFGRGEIFVAYGGAKDGVVSVCEAGWYSVLTVLGEKSPIKFGNGDPLLARFEFEGKVSDLSVEEKKEVVEILSSLSLK